MLRTLARLLALMLPRDRRRLGGLVALALLSSLMETIGVGALLPFIGIIADPTIIERQPALAALSTFTGVSDPDTFLRMLGLGIIALILTKNVSQFFIVRLRTRFVYRQQALLSARLMAGYMRAPWWWRLRRNSADLANAIKVYPDVALGVVTNSAMELVAEILVLAALCVLLTITAPMVMLVLGGLLVVLVLAFQAFFPQRMSRLGSEFSSQNADTQRRIQEGLGAAKEVRLLGREQFFIDRFAHVAQARGENQSEQEVMRGLPRQVLELVLAAGLVLAALVLLAQGRSPTMVVSVLGLFAATSFRLVPSFNRLVAAINNIQYGRPTVAVLLEEFATLEALDRKPLAAGEAGPRLDHELVFDRVTFRYPETEVPQLTEVSLTINRGQSVGVVGASGAGKSTLVDLALGLLTPSAGEILADGVPIEANLRAWQDRIGYVPQTIYLTDDTLRRNVALGLPDAEIDEDRLRTALAQAQLQQLVADLPQGLDTLVGELGGRLSGGQRQRIGIARALYNNPDLLVMDEATSALDGATEKDIGDALDALHGRKTVLLVAHRLSTVRHCDRIILLQSGRLAATGTFDELVAGNATFRRMVELADIS